MRSAVMLRLWPRALSMNAGATQTPLIIRNGRRIGAQRTRQFNSAAKRRAVTDETAAIQRGRPVRVSVDHDRSSLQVDLQGGTAVELPLLHLRDSCPCKTCRHEDTHQRLLDTFKLPARPSVRSAALSQDGLSVTWAGDEHQSLYTWSQLANLHSPQSAASSPATELAGEQPRYKLWGSSVARAPPTISYDEVTSSDEGVRKWTSLIRTHGFSFVSGTPATPEATESLLQRLSFIRATHYGGFWDFTSDLRSKDTAYTSLALDAHTDTNYFKDPAGLQMFHMLSHTDGGGGDSLFVDGYAAADALQAQSPRLADVLRRRPVLYECKGNDGVMLHASWPVLPAACTPADGTAIEPHDPLAPIRWNNSDRAAAQMGSAAEAEEWYEAARAFDKLLRDPQFEFWVKLKPGSPIIFDNYRVLHGRAAFTGKRRMCGGYINAQDFLSRWKTLNFSREILFAQTPQNSNAYASL